MRKILIVTLVILMAGVSSVFGDAVGSSFGCLTTARTLGMGSGSFGGGVGIADATSVFGSFNYGLSEFMDGRVKLGLVDADGSEDMELTFGADFKWQIWDTKGPIKREFDMAIGGFIEYCDFEVFSVDV